MAERAVPSDCPVNEGGNELTLMRELNERLEVKLREARQERDAALRRIETFEYGLDLITKQRDAARAALREAMTVVELMVLAGVLVKDQQRADQFAKWLRALGETDARLAEAE